MNYQRFIGLILLLSIVGIFCTDSNSPNMFNINVSIQPENAGSVSPSNDTLLLENSDFQLMANPAEGYSFTGWSGSFTSSDNPVLLNMTGNFVLTANFDIKSYALNIDVVGGGTVTETVIQAKTDYDHGTIVQLQAVPDEDWTFIGWSGDISGTDEIAQVTINQEMNITATFETEKVIPEDVIKTNGTQIYAHYMPWFQSKPYDGYWGSHWTLENKNPDNVDGNGKREIASHYYPLIGPYSSKDPDLVEYHLLLMKLTGIDGVMIDWYGTYDIYDYRDNLEGTEALIEKIEEVGLSFSIVYEDGSTENVVNQGAAASSLEAAKTDFEYIQANYFSHDNYLKVDDKNVALVFTPTYIQSGSSWSTIFENIDPKPYFLSIWGEKNDLGTLGSGEYAWVYNGNGNHLSLLQNFYNNTLNRYDLSIPSAYPGFVDFYEEGGRGDFIGWEIQHNGTATLEATLAYAEQNNPEHLQLVTWNDFGEGTMLEPTDEFGYSFLETIQEFAGVSYTVDELELVHQLYTLRKEFKDDADVQAQLDLVFEYLATLQISKASDLLDQLSTN